MTIRPGSFPPDPADWAGESSSHLGRPGDDHRRRQFANQLLAPPGDLRERGLEAALARLLKDAADTLGAMSAMLCVFRRAAPGRDLLLTLGRSISEPHLGSMPPFPDRLEPWPGVGASTGPIPAVLKDIANGGTLLIGGRGAGAESEAPASFPPTGPRLGCPVPGAASAGGALFMARAPGAPEFRPGDGALLAAVAGQAALLAERAYHNDQADKHERYELGLAQIADACMTAGSPGFVVQEVIDHVHRILGADGTCVWRIDPTTNALHLVAVRGMPGASSEAHIPLERHDALPVRALLAGELVQEDDARRIHGELADRVPTEVAYKSAVGIPLVSQETLFGAVTLYFRHGDLLSPQEERFLKNAVNLAAVAHTTDEARQARDRASAVYQTAIEESPVPLLVYRDDGAIISASDRVWDLTGLSRSAVHNIDEWYLRAFPEAAYRASIRRKVERGRVGNSARSGTDAEVACTDGSTRVWTIMHDLIDQANGAPLHFLAAVDVTEERQAQSDLRQATKMEAVGRLAGGIAHDFNNILTVITGYVDIAMSRMKAEHGAHKPLGEIALAAQKAGQLTEKLLVFSRRKSPRLTAVDLGAATRSVMRMAGGLLGDGIAVDLKLAADVAPVRIDRSSLEEVLLNMFVNARDAVGESGTIVVRTLAVSAGTTPPGVGGPALPTAFSLLLMSDDGCGMPPDVLARIFEPFFTTKEPGVGTGLGLAGAYAAITQAGGDIRVASVPEQGSTFGILLPALMKDVHLPSAVEEVQVAPPDSGSETVLIAEDRAQVRDLAAAILGELGYKVLVAANGVEALEIAEAFEGPIDLLLSDVIMPHMGGADLAERLRTLRPATRVLFMSGYLGRDLAAASLPTHAQHVLRKPFTASALGHRVRETLDRVDS